MAGASDLSAVKVWDLSDSGNAEWANIPTVVRYGDVGFLPDGRLVASGVDGDVRVHDLETGAVSPRIGPRVDEHMFAVSPDGSAIAYPGIAISGGTGVWSTETGQPIFTSGIEAELDGVAWSPDGTRLALTAPRLHATLIVDRTGDVMSELPDQDRSGTWVARFSPDGNLVATIGDAGPGDSLIAIWDWRREQLLRTMRTDFAQGLTFDPSGDRVITMFGPPVIWDVQTGARVGTLDVYPGTVGMLAFTPAGRAAATVGTRGVVLFNADTGAELLTLPLPDLRLPNRLAISVDGSKLATQAPSTLGGPGIIRVFALDIDDLLDLARREVTRPITGQECQRYWHADHCSA